MQGAALGQSRNFEGKSISSPPPPTVSATVTRDGVPVTDLEPVGDGFGRFVAVRRSDLAHLPLHPDTGAVTGDRAGPGIAFTARFPAPGGHRLFLDFRHAGVRHTAEFTLDVPAPGVG